MDCYYGFEKYVYQTEKFIAACIFQLVARRWLAGKIDEAATRQL